MQSLCFTAFAVVLTTVLGRTCNAVSGAVMTVVSCRVLNKPMAWVRAEVVGHSVVSVFLQSSGQNTRACPCNRKQEASNVIFVPWHNVQRCKFPSSRSYRRSQFATFRLWSVQEHFHSCLVEQGWQPFTFGSQHHFAFDVFRAKRASGSHSLPSRLAQWEEDRKSTTNQASSSRSHSSGDA